jgi:hypothetical protein
MNFVEETRNVAIYNPLPDRGIVFLNTHPDLFRVLFTVAYGL